MGNISQINGQQINAQSASYATVAQSVLGSITSASYAATASLLLGSVVSASYATTASYALTAQTLLGSITSASYAATASYSTTLGASITQPGGNDLRLYNSNGSSISTITSLTSSLSQKALTTTIIDASVYRLAMVPTGSAGAKQVYESAFSATYNGTTGHITATGFTGSIQGTASYATQALSASWAPSVGGGSPGGSANEVQYNNGAGGFAGAANVEISAAGNLNIVATTDPSTPAAGVLAVYSKTIAGRTLLKAKGPSGLDYPMQPALFQNAVYIWNQSSATGGVWSGTVGTGNGTFANTLPTTGGGGNAQSIQKRARYSNVVTTTNQTLGQRNTEAIFFRGAAAGQGGFFFYARCGFDTWTNGGRFFTGMATATTVITGDPSALNNTVGFAVDAADNGAISFLTRNAATATKQSTGLTLASGKGYDVFIFNAPNSDTFSYRIVDLITGTEYSNSTNATPPVAGTGLTANVLASNATTLTTANQIQLTVTKIYIETDY